MLVADSASITSRIEQAFQSASSSTGTSFEYLLKTAARESSFNPTAKASTSSATGLFQFVESTWLETMKEAGPQYGLSEYSDQISQTSSGKYVVKDAAERKEILGLRNDPVISSVMAGALTQKNSEYLQSKLGRTPSDGELYIAHFLGAKGATQLISAAADTPDTSATSMFPRQAKANKGIFYNRDGSSRSTSEVYDTLVSKHGEVSMIAQSTGRATTTAVQAASNDVGFGVNGFNATNVNKLKSDTAVGRVMSAWEATRPASPFEAMFRSDNQPTVTDASDFASAYASSANEQLFNRANAGANKVAAQIAGANQIVADPLDLTKYLNYQSRDEQKDLLPPV